MIIRFRPDYRHPFFPDVRPTPAPLARRNCTVLIGSYAELLKAAESGVQVKRAVYVLHGPETPFLNEDQRESLWQRFEVPVFALLLGKNAKLAAWECEVQEGLHTHSRNCEAPRAVRRVETAGCECGRPGSRLILDHTAGEKVFASSHARPAFSPGSTA